ncbi:putative aldose reductase [Besnoitia besnoiti]|uniref:Putative aldose reductase n=1 Tax=Besnoitia besnoiti TaxID=94643 RepID=A0A2A9MM81_BESBE|nr:putative aldose reductase [Besnoitia besnoiti]PFH38424.1 putative aldose reductase [Besnoitia besnoiti]
MPPFRDFFMPRRRTATAEAPPSRLASRAAKTSPASCAPQPSSDLPCLAPPHRSSPDLLASLEPGAPACHVTVRTAATLPREGALPPAEAPSAQLRGLGSRAASSSSSALASSSRAARDDDASCFAPPLPSASLPALSSRPLPSPSSSASSSLAHPRAVYAAAPLPPACEQGALSSPSTSSPSETLEKAADPGRGARAPSQASPRAPSRLRGARSATALLSFLRPMKSSKSHAASASPSSSSSPSSSFFSSPHSQGGGACPNRELALHASEKESLASHWRHLSSAGRPRGAHSLLWLREASARPPPKPEPLCVALRNGVLFPLLGLGTYRLHGEECVAVVKRAVSLRHIMLIDSASVYRNEEEVGKALRDAGACGFPWQLYLRDDCEANIRCRREASNLGVFLTSKLSPRDVAGGRQQAYEAALTSMKRLGVEQLDLYLIHWPGARGHKSSSRENRRLRHESWQALEQLYREKKVRAIGVSNFLVRHLEDLIEDGVEVVPMVNQIEFQPLCFDRDLARWAEKHDMRLQAYASLGSGDRCLLRHPTVQTVAAECGVTPALVLLRWGLQHGCHLIPCSTSEAHLIENTHVFDFSLSDPQMTLLDRLCDNTHFCWDPHVIA